MFPAVYLSHFEATGMAMAMAMATVVATATAFLAMCRESQVVRVEG